MVPANHSYTTDKKEEKVTENGFGYGSHVLLSDDGGETCSEIEHALQLSEPVCQASLIKYGQYADKKMFLFSIPAAADERISLTVKTRFDDCETWSNAKLIDE